MKEKYNKEFVVTGRINNRGILDDYTTLTAQPKDNTAMTIRVAVNDNGNGMSDTYVTRILCNQMSDKVAQNLKCLNGKFYIYSSMMIDAFELDNPSITLDEYITTNPKQRYSIYLFYSPDNKDFDKENVYNGLNNICKGMEISGNVYLHIMDDWEIKEAQKYLESHDKIYDEFDDSCELYNYGMFEFTNGRLDKSKEEVKENIRKKY